MGVLKYLFTTGFMEKDRPLSNRIYNLELVLAMGSIALVIAAAVNSNVALCNCLAWFIGTCAVYSFFICTLTNLWNLKISLGYVLLLRFGLWLPTEVACVIAGIVNVIKASALYGNGAGDARLAVMIIRGVNVLLIVSPVIFLPLVLKERAISRRSKTIIAYGSIEEKRFGITENGEERMEMHPYCFWTKRAIRIWLHPQFRDKDELFEGENYRVERKTDHITVFYEGVLIYDFSVNANEKDVIVYLPAEDKKRCEA